MCVVIRIFLVDTYTSSHGMSTQRWWMVGCQWIGVGVAHASASACMCIGN